jgi:hypothetical protein
LPPRRSPRLAETEQAITTPPQHHAISTPLTRKIIERYLILKSFKSDNVKDFAAGVKEFFVCVDNIPIVVWIYLDFSKGH